MDNRKESKLIVIAWEWDHIETMFDFGCHQFETYLPPLEEKL